MPFDPSKHLINLKGKEYLEIKWRLVWFREDHPDGTIQTELIEHEPGTYALFRAMVSKGDGEGYATGYGSETSRDFGDYLEKSESKAVGRALAMLGYGTQFAPELQEGERIVDAPVQRPAAPNRTPTPLNANGRSEQAAPRPQPQRQQAAPSQAPAIRNPGEPASDKQHGMLRGVATQQWGREEADARLHGQMWARFGKEHLAQLTKGEASVLIDALQKGDLVDEVPKPATGDPLQAMMIGGDAVYEEPAHLRESVHWQ